MTAASYALKVGEDEQEPAIVSVTGEVDVTNAAGFADAIGRLAAQRSTVLDLSDLLYLDSAAFAALHRLVAGYRVEIALTVNSPLRRAAALMGLPLHDSVEAASAALGRR